MAAGTGFVSPAMVERSFDELRYACQVGKSPRDRVDCKLAELGHGAAPAAAGEGFRNPLRAHLGARRLR